MEAPDQDAVHPNDLLQLPMELEVGGHLLPIELTIHALSFLGPRDRLVLSSVSRSFHALAEDDLQWRRLYTREWFKEDSEMPNGQSWERRSLPRVRDLLSWKQLYRLRIQLEHAQFRKNSNNSSSGSTTSSTSTTTPSVPPLPPLVNEEEDNQRNMDQEEVVEVAAVEEQEEEEEEEEEEENVEESGGAHQNHYTPALAAAAAEAARAFLESHPDRAQAVAALGSPASALQAVTAAFLALWHTQAAQHPVPGGDGDGGGAADEALDALDDAFDDAADLAFEADDLLHAHDHGHRHHPGCQHYEGQTQAEATWAAPEQRSAETYVGWGTRLRQLLPKVTSDEDDPVLLEEDRDKMEVRALYLICCEEFLSALSYGPTPEMQCEINFALADVTHQFAIYQRHFPHALPDLQEWYEAACRAFEQSYSEKLLSLRDRCSTLCSWAGAIRDYANSGAAGNERTEALFQLAYAKYQEALDLYGPHRPDYLLLENFAYALREHANFYVRTGNYAEARRCFDNCFSKYVECNVIHRDSIVLSNWADALREKAEIEDGDERERLFEEAHRNYELSSQLDEFDTLTQCNWAMLYCLRARTRHARARALRDDIEALKLPLRNAGQEEEEEDDNDEAIKRRRKEKEDEASAAEREYAQLLAAGKAKLEYGLEQDDPWSFFCMARLCAAANEPEQCRAWLDKCAWKRYLTKIKQSQLADFELVHELAWFQEMLNEQQQSDS